MAAVKVELSHWFHVRIEEDGDDGKAKGQVGYPVRFIP
jgi:hypothetical protein